MYDVWLFVELVVVYFLFVETSGASLEETAAIIDGVEAQEKLAEGVTRATEGEKKVIMSEETKEVAMNGI